MHLLERLRGLDSPLIRAVRGRGLWVGVELDGARVSARAVVERMAERGVLTKDTHETVIRFAPPLTISREQLDWGIDVFAACCGFEPAGAPSIAARLAPCRRSRAHRRTRRTTQAPTIARGGERPPPDGRSLLHASLSKLRADATGDSHAGTFTEDGSADAVREAAEAAWPWRQPPILERELDRLNTRSRAPRPRSASTCRGWCRRRRSC